MPVYVCLNYTNHLRDVFALIHESGHFACDTLQQKYLNGLQYGSVLACSETPSTFYELLLEDELLSHLDDEELLVYRVMSLGNIISQVHRQVAEYCFEQDLHRLFRQK